ncbi:MAG: DUF1810 domain-containing protein [Pseudomonadota bacterium]
MQDLERFVTAQEPVLEAALAELRAGHKRTHWMWFVFPQLRALGRSERALFYGINDLCEAQDYLAHPVLGPRLLECTEAAMTGYPRTAHQIFGSPDEMKFRSSMTLFDRTRNAPETFGRALDLFYDSPDPATVRLLAQAQ